MIAIDPGAKGAIVYDDDDGIICAEKMPDTPGSIVDALLDIKHATPTNDLRCVWEKTGTYMPGNSGPGAATFARHCGVIEGVLLAIGIPQQQVPPQKWQKHFGALPKDKGDRKRRIKQLMQERYPHLKVTLDNADALAIYTYAKEVMK